jgi:hypothetical protein
MGAADSTVREIIEEVSNSEYVLPHGLASADMTVVLYQEQLRKIGYKHWSKWTNCSEESYNRIKAEPFRNGWEWRARKLFVTTEENYE